ncbi:MAG: hypothetical protein GY832_14365 [Chloroflexi bacterium]|nr:hypothetical protein [Chloroflexota bacterium]
MIQITSVGRKALHTTMHPVQGAIKMLGELAERFPDKGPCKQISMGMGHLIQQTRFESEMTPTELAQKAYTSQKTPSAFESGEKEVSTSELTYSAAALDKPILYFFPEWVRQALNPDHMTMEEYEVLLLIKKPSDEERRKLIAQIHALVNVS